MLILHVSALCLGFLLDLLLGDPPWLYHPVVLMGKAISWMEKGLRRILPGTCRGEFWGGLVLVVSLGLLFLGIPGLVLWLCYRLLFPLGFALEVFWCGQLLAARSLDRESRKVYKALEAGDLDGGRYAVSRIVGRDTEKLTEQEVVKATLETIAENTADGVTAPAFYMVLGGAPLLFLYKLINTCDSMLGYKNPRYLYFGRAAARLDDVVNLLPARLCALLMLAAARLLGYDARQGWKVYRRDRKNLPSPNAGQTEAVMAGALRLQLAGDMWYFGRLVHKKTLGDPLREPERRDILRALRLTFWTNLLTLLFLSLAGGLGWLLGRLLL